MPLLAIRTNVDAAPDVKAEFVAAASKRIATALGKPEKVVMVSLDTGVAMAFAGTAAPAAFVDLRGLGLPTDRTGELSTILCDLVEEGLGVPAARVFVNFADWPRHMWGWDRRTF